MQRLQSDNAKLVQDARRQISADESAAAKDLYSVYIRSALGSMLKFPRVSGGVVYLARSSCSLL